MQGKRNYSEKLFVSFQLSDRISKENLYRRLGVRIEVIILTEFAVPCSKHCAGLKMDPDRWNKPKKMPATIVSCPSLLHGKPHYEIFSRFRQLLQR